MRKTLRYQIDLIARRIKLAARHLLYIVGNVLFAVLFSDAEFRSMSSAAQIALLIAPGSPFVLAGTLFSGSVSKIEDHGALPFVRAAIGRAQLRTAAMAPQPAGLPPCPVCRTGVADLALVDRPAGAEDATCCICSAAPADCVALPCCHGQFRDPLWRGLTRRRRLLLHGMPAKLVLRARGSSSGGPTEPASSRTVSTTDPRPSTCAPCAAPPGASFVAPHSEQTARTLTISPPLDEHDDPYRLCGRPRVTDRKEEYLADCGPRLGQSGPSLLCHTSSSVSLSESHPPVMMMACASTGRSWRCRPSCGRRCARTRRSSNVSSMKTPPISTTAPSSVATHAWPYRPVTALVRGRPHVVDVLPARTRRSRAARSGRSRSTCAGRAATTCSRRRCGTALAGPLPATTTKTHSSRSTHVRPRSEDPFASSLDKTISVPCTKHAANARAAPTTAAHVLRLRSSTYQYDLHPARRRQYRRPPAAPAETAAGDAGR
jgi:hypothetical protein